MRTSCAAAAGLGIAGIAEAGELPRMLLGAGHRARTSPSGRWLAELSDALLADPAVISRLRLTTSNLVVYRGGRLEHEGWRGGSRPGRPRQAG